MTKIAVFVGSLRENSSNRMLAESMEKLAPEGMVFEYIDIRLPLYSEDIENAGVPEEVQKRKSAVEAADGVLFMTPEYNRSVPGVLKNAIDWISRPYGQTSFASKPVGIVGSSTGPTGTAVAQADLRRIMLFQNAKVLGQPEVYVANAGEVFDETGTLKSERWEKNFREYMAAFDAWIKSEK
jgi:chromate reductase